MELAARSPVGVSRQRGIQVVSDLVDQRMSWCEHAERRSTSLRS